MNLPETKRSQSAQVEFLSQPVMCFPYLFFATLKFLKSLG